MAHNAEELLALLNAQKAGLFSSESDRISIRNAAHAMLSRLETPWDACLRYFWTQPAFTAALKAGVDVGLFKKWKEAGGGVKSSKELADMTGVDAALMSRLLRYMASLYALQEEGENLYSMTPFAMALGEPGFQDTVLMFWDINGPGFLNLPSFLATNGYRNPSNPAQSKWHHISKEKVDLFTWLGARPDILGGFQKVMITYAANKSPMTKVFPLGEVLQAASPGDVAVVDVWGGSGHDLERILAQHPDLCQRSLNFVLQDLPDVIGETRVTTPISKLAHDFSEPQPIKGAWIYYLHNILHDWADAKGLDILSNIKPAMERTRSRILLHEMVVAARHADVRSTTSDLTMMMLFSALERTESMWTSLIETAGLHVAKIWTAPESDESVIEVVLPQATE